jgi:hypothetical protein
MPVSMSRLLVEVIASCGTAQDAMVRLTWTWMLLCGDDRGKTAKHLLECKQFVIELAVRGYKVDQHW